MNRAVERAILDLLRAARNWALANQTRDEMTAEEHELFEAYADLWCELELGDRPAYGGARSRLQLPRLEA